MAYLINMNGAEGRTWTSDNSVFSFTLDNNVVESSALPTELPRRHSSWTGYLFFKLFEFFRILWLQK